MEYEEENKPLRGILLETTTDDLTKEYQDHISEVVSTYLSDNDLTMDGAAKHLGYTGFSISRWIKKDRIQPIDVYFTVRSRMQYGNTEQADLESVLAKGYFKDYIGATLSKYLSNNNLSQKQFSEDTGIKSNIIKKVLTKESMPKPRYVFKVLSATLRKGQKPYDILELVTNMEILSSPPATQTNMLDKLRAVDDSNYGLDGLEMAVTDNDPIVGPENEVVGDLESQIPIDRSKKFINLLYDLEVELILYRSVGVTDREEVRKGINLQELTEILIEARQLLRSEERYQEWLNNNR